MSRCPPTRARRGTPADRDDLVVLLLHPARPGLPRPCECARWTTAPTSAPSPRARSTSMPLQHLRVRRRRGSPRRTTRPPSSWASGSSPTTTASSPGVRFYKGTGNTGTHVGSLWSPSGERLAQATFSNESATGWQSVTFATPVRGHGRTAVRRVVHRAQGHYALEQLGLLRRQGSTRPAHGGRRVSARPPAGVYAAPGRLPERRATRTPTTSSTSSFTTTDSSAADRDEPVAAAGLLERADDDHGDRALRSKPCTPGTVALTLKDANGVDGAGRDVVRRRPPARSPSPRRAPLAGFVKHTATVTGRDNGGNPVATGKHLVVHDRQAAEPARGVPVHAVRRLARARRLRGGRTGMPVTLGVRVHRGHQRPGRPASGSTRASTTPAAHTGTLWAADGTVLATGTFTDESTTGWQTLTFPTPVTIAQGHHVRRVLPHDRGSVLRHSTPSRPPTCRGPRCG